MHFRLPLAVTLILVAATAAVGVDQAGACTCAPLDPRDRLADGDPAVLGEVVARRATEPAGYAYTVRVEDAFNATLGAEVVIDGGSMSAACGFTWRVGQRVGAFLHREAGEWTTDLCSLIAPAELRRALEPYPRARGHGRVALLAGGSFTKSRLMALDRNLRTLRIVHSRRAPKDTGELRCANRAGTSLFAAGIRYTRASPHGRVRVVRLTRRRPIVLATVPGDTVALARGTAYVADSTQILEIDLSDGGVRSLALFPNAGSLAPSPDGARLAVSAARHGVRVIHLATGRVIGSAPAGQPFWSSPNRLLVRGVGRPRLYDSDLRPLRRLPAFRVGSQAPLGDVVFGVDGRRLVSLDLQRARRTLVGLLPDQDTFALEAVPGAPLLRTRRAAPAGTVRCRNQPS